MAVMCFERCLCVRVAAVEHVTIIYVVKKVAKTAVWVEDATLTLSGMRNTNPFKETETRLPKEMDSCASVCREGENWHRTQ